MGLAVVLVAVMGCGPSFARVGRVGPLELRVEEPVSGLLLERIAADVAAARASFESGTSSEGRWRLGAGEFNSKLDGLVVYVHRAVLLRGHGGGTFVGLWNPGAIDVNCRGDALPHELMHELDYQAGNLLTSQHLGWDEVLDEGMLKLMSRGWLAECPAESHPALGAAW